MNDATGGPRARAGGTASAVAARISLPTYDVTVAPGSLDSVGDVARRVAPAHRYAVVTDGNVGPLYARRVVESFAGEPLHVVDIPAGEAQKTRANWGQVTDALLDAGCGRDTTIVALGGGVVGDLAGFVAATFMRGVPYVQVPTTLLAMVDASVGGKTGVDTPAGKNLVGAFHQPVAVIVDPAVLATLPLAHRRAGLAEALKHGIIADAGYFDRTAHDPDSLWIGAESDRVTALIARSIEIKADVVRRDEREGAAQGTQLRAHARARDRGGEWLRPAPRRGGRDRDGPRERARRARRCGRCGHRDADPGGGAARRPPYRSATRGGGVIAPCGDSRRQESARRIGRVRAPAPDRSDGG